MHPIIVTYQIALMLQVSGREMIAIECLSKCQCWIMTLALRMQGWLLLLLSLHFLSLTVHGSCPCLQTIPVFLLLHFQQYLLPEMVGKGWLKQKQSLTFPQCSDNIPRGHWGSLPIKQFYFLCPKISVIPSCQSILKLTAPDSKDL